MRQTYMFFGALALLFAAWALEMTFGPVEPGDVFQEDAIVFSRVQPIFKDRCSHCHRGPMDWTKYEIAKKRALTIRTRVVVFKNMPPIGTEISAEERDLIRRWVDGGAKE